MPDPLKATKLIPDFDRSKIETWVKNFRSLVDTKKARHLESYERGGDLYQVGDVNNGYYFLDVAGDIVYFVRYRQVKAGGNTFGRQVLVARLSNRVEATKVAAHVFFNYLLPTHKSLSTDTEQTRHGQGFWAFALSEAFMKGLYVYAYDRRSTPNTLVRLESAKELNNQLDVLWGHDEGHKRTHAIISKVPLAIKDKLQRKTGS